MPRIFLIEDDDQLRLMLKEFLTDLGYQVWEARNGMQVGKMYQQHPPDLVITDLVMPEKEGLEMMMELRQQDQKVRIIAMSGGGRGKGSAESYLRLAQRLGAQYTLIKPFSLDEFTEAIRLVLTPEE